MVKKAQSFSADILVVIVIVLFGALFLVINKISEEQNEDLLEKAREANLESKEILDYFRVSGILDEDNNINIDQLISADLDSIKEELGIKNEFAIVFEKNGKLVKIDPASNLNCKGSSNIIVNGEACR
jgi:hypothetical protein